MAGVAGAPCLSTRQAVPAVQAVLSAGMQGSCPPHPTPPPSPVELLTGGSSGLENIQPQCWSSGLSGRVRCQVGCVTDTLMTSCRPCAGWGRAVGQVGG